MLKISDLYKIKKTALFNINACICWKVLDGNSPIHLDYKYSYNSVIGGK